MGVVLLPTITIILSIITMTIFIVIKKTNDEKKFNIIDTYYDGLSLYYYQNVQNNAKTNFDEYHTIINNIEREKKCLNGGIPNMKNNIFSECNCPDNNFIGPLCQYENLMRPGDGITFTLI